MRVLIVSDAWEPQVNGVVRTLQAMQRELTGMGHEVGFITPDLYRSLPCPTYPEIRLAMAWPSSVGERIAAFAPDAIHLATEGPLCLAARRYCLTHGLAFTTAYHTQFPDYIERRTGIPASAIWRYIRWFHGAASTVLASTPSIREELRAQGITRLAAWGRGVDLTIFGPHVPPHPALAGLAGPIMLYVGRIAVEKNIAAFLECRHPGTKVIVGDGPARAELAAAHPQALFLGKLEGQALAAVYSGADVFVFPSRTDTFGLVIIEALASGTPVAGYPVTGPKDIVTPETGALDEDLDIAIAAALIRDRGAAAALGASYSWRASAEQFLAALVPARSGALEAA
jgi:glycosyltransferase involved in cell wall biosynthesis